MLLKAEGNFLKRNLEEFNRGSNHGLVVRSRLEIITDFLCIIYTPILEKNIAVVCACMRV